jgi:hypothetical protein
MSQSADLIGVLTKSDLIWTVGCGSNGRGWREVAAEKQSGAVTPTSGGARPNSGELDRSQARGHDSVCGLHQTKSRDVRDQSRVSGWAHGQR